jgi:predicted metal-dependent hydrolase
MVEHNYPAPWMKYLYDFHVTRDYFQCHEHLEEYWKHTGQMDRTLVAFIQLAVGAYHARRENKAGALKMWKQALADLAASDEPYLGMDLVQLRADVAIWIKRLLDDLQFEDAELPFADVALKSRLVDMAKQKGRQFGDPSDIHDIELTHRHMRRDRTEVIESRLQSLARKRGIAVDD